MIRKLLLYCFCFALLNHVSLKVDAEVLPQCTEFFLRGQNSGIGGCLCEKDGVQTCYTSFEGNFLYWTGLKPQGGLANSIYDIKGALLCYSNAPTAQNPYGYGAYDDKPNWPSTCGKVIGYCDGTFKPPLWPKPPQCCMKLGCNACQPFDACQSTTYPIPKTTMPPPTPSPPPPTTQTPMPTPSLAPGETFAPTPTTLTTATATMANTDNAMTDPNVSVTTSSNANRLVSTTLLIIVNFLLS